MKAFVTVGLVALCTALAVGVTCIQALVLQLGWNILPAQAYPLTFGHASYGQAVVAILCLNIVAAALRPNSVKS
jgi:hypothetical protein